MTLRTARWLPLALALAVTGAAAQDPDSTAGPRCAPEAAVTCPARNELTVVAGWAPESYSTGFAWTGVRRLGAYLRAFPGLDPSPGTRPNATVTAESLREFGLAYRWSPRLTVGAGWGRYTKEVNEYSSVDINTGQPTLLSSESSATSGPALFLAWAFHPPPRAIGFAASISVGAAGSGVAIGTSLRFPRFRTPLEGM